MAAKAIFGLNPSQIPEVTNVGVPAGAGTGLGFAMQQENSTNPKNLALTEYTDQDPIRRKCVGRGDNAAAALPMEQVCGADGTLGVVLPIVVPSELTVAQLYPSLPCEPAQGFYFGPALTRPSGTPLRCPNGDAALAAQCFLPVRSDLSQPDGIAFDCINPPGNVPQVVFDTDGDGSQFPDAPGTDGRTDVDGRAYNLILREPNGAIRRSARPDPTKAGMISVPVAGAFYRIHSTRSLLSPPAQASNTCVRANSDDQMGCLTTASPCSVGFAARSAVSSNPGTSSALVNGVAPSKSTIQALLKGGVTYPFAHKVYLNTVRGFEQLHDPNRVVPEEELSKCFASLLFNGTVNVESAGIGLVKLPAPTGSTIEKPLCEDFNGATVCGDSTNDDACLDNGVISGGSFPRSSCSNGLRDGAEATTDVCAASPAPGWISAFAGSGTRGASPSGTAALATKLDSPSGLALCPDGALYVSDTGNNRVVKFKDGQMTVVVAGQTTPNGKTYGNLLLNPRAESPIISTGAIPGWTVVSPASGWSEVPWEAMRPQVLDGEQMFRANPAASGEMYQDVDVSPYSSAIDASTQFFGFTGFVHSLSEDTNPDAAQVIVEYRNFAGQVLFFDDLLPQQVRGEWLRLGITRAAPVGTRWIRVRLISTRHTGLGNDAFYDGLLLRAFAKSDDTYVPSGVPAVDASLSLPHGLACDTDGSLYIADTYNNQVRVVVPNGTIYTVAGCSGRGPPPLSLPTCGGSGASGQVLALPMAVSLNHSFGTAGAGSFKLIFSDYLSHRIIGVTSPFEPMTTVVSGDGAPCSGDFPTARCTYYPMAVDVVGNVGTNPGITIGSLAYYGIANEPFGADTAVALATNGGFQDVLNPPVNFWGFAFGATRRPVAITSVAADPSGQAVDPRLARGSYYNWRGTPSESVPGFFIADLANHAVRHETYEGFMQTVAGNGTVGDSGDNGPAYKALLTAPSALAESKDGTVYVADAETNRIRKISCGDVNRCMGDAYFNGSSCTWTTAAPKLNDANPCTDDECLWTVGADHQPYVNQGTVSCSDGNPCNGNEICSGTQCVVGTGPLAPNSSCSDGNPCNGTEVCNSSYQCVGGTPFFADTNPCTVQSCSATGGVATANVANGTTCSTSNLCKNAGTCQGGQCSATDVALDTSNPCVTYSCSSTLGITHTFNAVSCNGGMCNAGSCVPTGGPSAGALSTTVPPTTRALLADIYDTSVNPNPVQTGVGLGQINPDHAARLFGTVAVSDGGPGAVASPEGVRVVVVNHPEFGQTLTRANGQFDIVANGGGPVVLRFTKLGYLTVDRQATPLWGGGAHIDDVTMVKVDSKSTPITVNSAIFQDATGTKTTSAMDPRGDRQARVVFPPNTTATAISDGVSTPLNGGITVRATEFTVGTSSLALNRMPAPLPPSSLYTYAVDFSVDGATSVVFSQPLFAYVDNFLGLPAGANVPSGSYDPNKAAWVPEANGKVVAVVGYNGGAAIIDVTGDGFETQADTDFWNALPSNQRLTTGERTLIASSYPDATSTTPKSLWRVPLTHFSYYDFNYGGGVECVNNKCPDFAGEVSGGADAPKDGSCQGSGSIIDFEEQSLGERLAVMGTPFFLNYKSSYTLGYLPPRGTEVDFNPPPSVLTPKATEVTVSTPSGFWKRTIKSFPDGLRNYVS